MFTQNTTNLAAVTYGLSVEVRRDGHFSYVGKIPSNLVRRVVPELTPNHIEQAISENGIVGLIVKPQYESLVPVNLALVVAEDPIAASLHIHERICAMEGFLWNDFDSRISPNAEIHASAVISERNVEIAADVIVGPNSVVLERSILEQRVRIGPGVVIGLDALEVFEGAAPRRILVQAGGVIIEEGATLLANCTVARATFGGFTRVGRNVMIDGLVHVAHDVSIGDDSTITACAEISGRCELGEGSYVGPNACIRNGAKIGRNATVSIGSVVTKDVPDGAVVTGNFAVEHNIWLNFVRTLNSTMTRK